MIQRKIKFIKRKTNKKKSDLVNKMVNAEYDMNYDKKKMISTSTLSIDYHRNIIKYIFLSDFCIFFLQNEFRLIAKAK